MENVSQMSGPNASLLALADRDKRVSSPALSSRGPRALGAADGRGSRSSASSSGPLLSRRPDVATPARRDLGSVARALTGGDGWLHARAKMAAEMFVSGLENLGAERRSGQARRGAERQVSREMILQIIQPGLVGLMDGSISTLAPVFAAVFATHNSWNGFLVGMAASLGAGISMGFAEGLADDGKISGRGAPLLRGLVCGLMTIAGGIGHTLPYLISDVQAATVMAVIAAVLELLVIAWIQWRFMNVPPISAAAKVMAGGGLVLATGILIGSS